MKTILFIYVFISFISENERYMDIPIKDYREIEYKLTNEEYDEAYMDSLIKQYPNSKFLIGVNSYFRCTENDFSKVEEILQQSEEDKKNTYVLMGIALYNYKKGNEEKAIQQFKECLQLDKERKNKWLRYELYLYYKDKGDLSQAHEYILDALEIDSHFTLAQIELGYVFEITGDLDNALITYKDILSRVEIDYIFISAADIYYYHKNNKETAIEYYKKTINLNDNINAYASLILHYMNEENDMLTAEMFLTQMIEKHPDKELTYSLQATYFMLNNDNDNAKGALIKAIKIEPTKESYSGLVELLLTQENYIEAIEYNNKARNLYSDLIEFLLFDLVLANRYYQDKEKAQQIIDDVMKLYDFETRNWFINEAKLWGITINFE